MCEIIAGRAFEKSESIVEIIAFHHFLDFFGYAAADAVLDDVRLPAEIVPIIQEDLLD